MSTSKIPTSESAPSVIRPPSLVSSDELATAEVNVDVVMVWTDCDLLSEASPSEGFCSNGLRKAWAYSGLYSRMVYSFQELSQ
eukprot:CAMPEP_0114440550 /NCGR_PEP_ID=MMETSP0103-20121206/15844_1 /TAXON_ID=37642 ORGANISM="Paraphysomonas imperforata, Strain PA2" /NCGR_SAMPLE_ID=MMETSP0103 /ASSEMBLY_ACC=CAM_ASM_000201 /LENGTH=82 /DNA_ID=CAMNT_0001611491 /DNA_START=89 /DNA_END=337 /DNA_ORIENTATION=+